MATGSHDRVANVFSLLIWEDGERIGVRAKAFLEQFAPSYFAEKGLTTAMIEDRLRMEMFGANVLVSTNLELMEQPLGQGGFETHRDQIKLDQLISLQIDEAVQQRAMEKTWADIEADLANVMAAAAR